MTKKLYRRSKKEYLTSSIINNLIETAFMSKRTTSKDFTISFRQPFTTVIKITLKRCLRLLMSWNLKMQCRTFLVLILEQQEMQRCKHLNYQKRIQEIVSKESQFQREIINKRISVQITQENPVKKDSRYANR